MKKPRLIKLVQKSRGSKGLYPQRKPRFLNAVQGVDKGLYLFYKDIGLLLYIVNF